MGAMLTEPPNEALGTLLAEAVRDIYGAHTRLERWHGEVLAERRGRRIARYDLVVRQAGDEAGGTQVMRWIGKYYFDQPETAARVERVLRALEAQDFTGRAGAVTSRVVARVPDLRLLLLTYVPGERVLALIDHAYENIVERIAQALAAFHEVRIELDRVKTPSGVIANLRQRAEDLCIWFPDEAGHIRGALAAIERSAPRVMERPSLLHADFGASQLLWHDERLGILDFDKCALGDPALDLGNFILQLRRRAILDAPGSPVEEMRALLLSAYARHSANPASLQGLDARVAWHERAILLKKVHFFARQMTAVQQEQALRLLGLLMTMLGHETN